MVVQPTYLEEILAHLELVQQLATHIRLETDDDMEELDGTVGRLLDTAVSSVAPILPHLEGASEFSLGNMSFSTSVKPCKGFVIVVPEYHMRYRGNMVFNSVILTTKGDLATVDSGWGESSPWYHLTLVRTDVVGHINFTIVFLESLLEMLKDKLPILGNKSEVLEQLHRWLNEGRELLASIASE